MVADFEYYQFIFLYVVWFNVTRDNINALVKDNNVNITLSNGFVLKLQQFTHN